MELWPALSTILLFITLLLPARKAGFQVSQEPRSINATVNGSVTLSCSFNTNIQGRAQVMWLWGPGDGVKLEIQHPFHRGRLRTSLLGHMGQIEAKMVLSALEERDSGLYRCCIETFPGQRWLGDGTLLRVMGRQQGERGEGQGMCPHGSIELAAYRAGVALGAAAFLTMTILLLLQRHKATAAKTREQQLMQGDAQVSSERSDNMHYAEIKLTSRQGAARAPIWNKSQESTEYAPIQTRPL